MGANIPLNHQKHPRVSIGLPVYNGADFIEKTLNSILTQTFEDFELIISDNASTDATEEICRDYAAQDNRIRYYRNAENLGASRNYNRVFELSTGEYFKWAAHDDVCAPTYLERCVELLDREPAVSLCYAKSRTIDEHDQDQGIYSEGLNFRSPYPHERFYQFLTLPGRLLLSPAFGMARSHLLKKTMLIGNYTHADRVLTANLALLGECWEIPEFLFLRRVHPNTSVRANPTEETLILWYDPRNKGKANLLKWSRYFAYMQAIRRSELSWDEQLRCYQQLLRRSLRGSQAQFQGNRTLSQVTSLQK